MIQALQLVNDYEEEKVDAAVARCMDALHIARDLKKNMKIVIKPNMVVARTPNVPATTHPLVVRAVAKYLRAQGMENIVLAESGGGLYNAETFRHSCRVCGMDKLQDVLTLNDDFSAQTVPTKAGFMNHSFHLLTPIVNADYVINVCKLKTHTMTGLSGGIKNLFGCIPGLEKPQMHYLRQSQEDFADMLLELVQTVRPQVTLIDAVDAMEGNGPTGGTSHPLHMLLASRDVFTQDWFAATLMGIAPDEIPMLRRAKARGLIHENEMQIAGDAVPPDLVPFKRPDTGSLTFTSHVPAFLRKPFSAVVGRILRSYPQLQKEKCIGCGKCAESCPAHIIKIENRKAIFRHRGCISCFCCQEMCPKKAISVRKAL